MPNEPVMTLVEVHPGEDTPAVTSDRAVETDVPARRTLALRLAHRSRLREMRAERLARLRAERMSSARQKAAPVASGHRTVPESEDDSAAALDEFLAALTRGRDGLPPPARPVEEPAPAAVLPFQRRAPAPENASSVEGGETSAPVCDLDRLPGVEGGLIWALRRAGIRTLSDLAPLTPDDIAARLGPLGRLVPAATWIALAQAMAVPTASADD